MSGICKHGPYATFCRECDLETIERYARDRDGSPEGGDAEGGSVRSTTARADRHRQDNPALTQGVAGMDEGED